MNFPRGARGSTLVLNLLVMGVFAATSVIVYKAAKTMVMEAVYFERSAQAQAIAESGVEDALHSLYSTSSWRTGFYQKSLGGGYYTVSVTSASAISLNVTSTGYSAPFLLGRAVKSVGLTVQFVSSTTPTTAVLSSNLVVNGTVDAYDPRVNLSPSTGSFVDGGTVWADNVTTGGSCASVRIKASVIVYNAAPPAVASGNSPGSGCVNTPTDTISSTNTIVNLPYHLCNAACKAVAAVNNATIPATYRSGSALAETLTITSAQTLSLSSGTYYFKQVFIDGTLNLNTSSGPVTIYYTNQWRETSPCAVNNISKWPSDLLIADVGGGHTVTLNCTAPHHAYMEGSSNHFTVSSGAELYGHFSGADATIDSGGKLHVDLSEGVSATHLTWTTGSSGSWSESYKRQ